MPNRSESKLAAGFDPRQRIYRDPYNEYLVFLVSAVGAAVVAPVALLIVAALTERPNFFIWLGASVAIELILIFGIVRPAMKTWEKYAWSLLWGFTAAVLGAAFYSLVVVEVL